MHSNRFWQVFIGAIGLIVVGYSGGLIYKLYEYLILSQTVPASSISWSTYSFDHDNFAPQANYTFVFQEKNYSGRAIWNDENYPNPWAVDTVLIELSKKNWRVWINPSHPEHSTLQKKFPYKELFSTVTLYILLIYFIGLGVYVRKTSKR